jgi:anthranilate synthase component 1
LGETFNRITVYREIEGDLITPVILLKIFENEDNIFLFESANLDKSFSRFSFFGYSPEKIIDSGDINFLKNLSKKEKVYSNSDFGDFSGGVVGFLSYEAVNHMDILRTTLTKKDNFPDFVFFQVDKFFVFDNHRFRLYAAVSVKVGEDKEKSYNLAVSETVKMERELEQRLNSKTEDRATNAKDNKFDKVYSEMEKDEFIKKVNCLKQQIEEGECIQVVLSNRFSVFGNFSHLDFYRALRRINPSPYMFYIKFKDKVLCGSSPETHLKVNNQKALLKPIAGTYPITDKDNFKTLANKIKNDEKEMSEHLMLLDLARNDLSTLCIPSSVKVEKSFEVEKYSHLIHIVSEVTGILPDGISPFELFCKTFPAGTVSGAPKVRAMELINSVEKSDRGFYSGCVGYFGYNGCLDTCITIRTALFEKDKVTFRAGAGIVYDSNPESEYLEVYKKTEALFNALKKISKEGE